MSNDCHYSYGYLKRLSKIYGLTKLNRFLFIATTVLKTCILDLERLVAAYLHLKAASNTRLWILRLPANCDEFFLTKKNWNF